MPKLKTHRGTYKRAKITANRKLLRKRAYGNHFLRKKSSARKRRYAKEYELKPTYAKKIRKLLGV